MTRPLITQARLKELVHYDPETGLIRWRHDGPGKGVVAGAIAGTRNKDGYIVIRMDGRNYRAHRLAWLYVYGVWPEDETDHVNRRRDENWLSNLREATRTQNNRNVLPRGTSGLKGVTRRSQGWEAAIYFNKRSFYLGTFRTGVEAATAYDRAAKQFHGEFASTNASLGLLP